MRISDELLAKLTKGEDAATAPIHDAADPRIDHDEIMAESRRSGVSDDELWRVAEEDWEEMQDMRAKEEAVDLIIAAHAMTNASQFGGDVDKLEKLIKKHWPSWYELREKNFSSRKRYHAFCAICEAVEKASDRICRIYTDFIPARELVNVELIIFDIDGTIAKWNDPVISPEAAYFLARYGQQFKLDIATNQGGPACRDAFKSERYPSYTTVTHRVEVIRRTFARAVGVAPQIFVCWAWTRKDGSESFVPNTLLKDAQSEEEINAIVIAEAARRKPSGAMLLEAMAYHGVAADQTLFVGDRDSDEQAAKNAGVRFRRIQMD